MVDAPNQHAMWADAMGNGDLQLQLRDGSQILAHSQFLAMASPIIMEALQCNRPVQGRAVASEEGQREQALGGQIDKAEQAAASTGTPTLAVEGDQQGWTMLLKCLYHAVLTGEPAELPPSSAFHVLPIAHVYNMRGLLHSCVKSVQQCKLPLGPPLPLGSGPLGNGGQAMQEPSLFQWLALGDACQFSPLVRACLAQLGQGEALPAVRSALSCPQSRSHLDQLCSGTLLELMNVASGLPPNFKGVRVPDLTQARPSFQKEGEAGVSYGWDWSCYYNNLEGPVLLTTREEECLVVWNISTGSASELEGHSEAIASIATSSSNHQLALTGSRDTSVRLWDLASCECRLTFEEHDDHVWRVCFCGQDMAASGSQYGHIKVWDLATGAATLPDLPGDACHIYSLQATPDGRLLLSTGHHCLKMWDVRDGRCVRTMPGHTDTVYSASMDDHGRMAVSGSEDMTVRTWDLGSGRCLATLQSHECAVNGALMDWAGSTALSFSPDDHTVRVWDLSRHLLTATHSWPGQAVENMCASRDLSRVAVILRDPYDDAVEARSIIKMWSTA